MTVLDQLLRLQGHDTHLAQLRHRRATLPERDALERQRAAIAEHDGGTAVVQEERDALGREQKRLEDEVAIVEAKAAEVDTTLYSGTVTSPRELQGFQDELQALRRRQRQLEDEVLAVMERLEPLDEDLSRRAAARADLVVTADELSAALDAAEADLDTEIGEIEAERAGAAEPLPADLLTRYDRLRAQHEGIAIAPLVGNSCGGCHLVLSAVEVDRIKREPPDALIFCEECGRLLVR